MTPGETYRVMAAKLDAKARDEGDPSLKRELFGLAASYRRLSEQADRNASVDVSYMTPDARPQVRQQPQPKRKNKT